MLCKGCFCSLRSFGYSVPERTSYSWSNFRCSRVAAGVVQAASQAKPIFWDPPMDKVEEIHDDLNAAARARALGSTRKDFMNEVERNKMKAPSETCME
ncbi:hypothetical protein ACSBR1_019039 [Camellia fascicularis]